MLSLLLERFQKCSKPFICSESAFRVCKRPPIYLFFSSFSACRNRKRRFGISGNCSVLCVRYQACGVVGDGAAVVTGALTELGMLHKRGYLFCVLQRTGTPFLWQMLLQCCTHPIGCFVFRFEPFVAKAPVFDKATLRFSEQIITSCPCMHEPNQSFTVDTVISLLCLVCLSASFFCCCCFKSEQCEQNALHNNIH